MDLSNILGPDEPDACQAFACSRCNVREAQPILVTNTTIAQLRIFRERGQIMQSFARMSGQLIAMFVLAFAAFSVAAAERCDTGTLDKRYCDRDLDQTADLPSDPNEWVDPDTLIFTYTPVEDPAVYASIWDGFVNHMSKVTGKKLFSSRSKVTPHSLKQCAPGVCMSLVLTPGQTRSP